MIATDTLVRKLVDTCGIDFQVILISNDWLKIGDTLSKTAVSSNVLGLSSLNTHNLWYSVAAQKLLIRANLWQKNT